MTSNDLMYKLRAHTYRDSRMNGIESRLHIKPRNFQHVIVAEECKEQI